MTTSWAAFEAADSDAAGTVRQRFQQFPHHVLATLRRDGSPRVSGIEVVFLFGELWLGMMPDSRKARDLWRDPRFALQANPGPDASMAGGDVRVAGRAVEETDPVVITRFAEEVHPPQPFHLFRTDLAEVVRTHVDGDDLVVLLWRPGHPVRTIRRGTDDSPPRGIV
jgi:hypothetical protein